MSDRAYGTGLGWGKGEGLPARPLTPSGPPLPQGEGMRLRAGEGRCGPRGGSATPTMPYHEPMVETQPPAHPRILEIVSDYI